MSLLIYWFTRGIQTELNRIRSTRVNSCRSFWNVRGLQVKFIWFLLSVNDFTVDTLWSKSGEVIKHYVSTVFLVKYRSWERTLDRSRTDVTQLTTTHSGGAPWVGLTQPRESTTVRTPSDPAPVCRYWTTFGRGTFDGKGTGVETLLTIEKKLSQFRTFSYTFYYT